MKDFDVEREAELRADVRDRTFKIGGETFAYKAAVRPDILSEWDQVRPPALAADGKTLLRNEDGSVVDAGTPSSEVLAIEDRLIGMFLAPVDEFDDPHARWAALRAREDDPIRGKDMLELIKWLVGEQVGRPTEAPSPSGDGRAANGTGSTPISSTPPVAASTG